ncbi:MAG: tyrosine-type recombinase/integrase [Bacteroidota bacterium]|nr:tyrosine-type recombinase/integrase [Bacteroidota bacterium]
MSYQEEFLKYLQYEKRCSLHTIKAYRIDLDQFVIFSHKRVGDFDVSKIDFHLLREWVVFLMENKTSARSVNRKISTLKSFFKYLLREEVVLTNPADGLIKPKMEKKLPVFVGEDALNILLDKGFFSHTFEGKRDKLILTLLYGTGVRLAELMNLKKQGLNMQSCEIKVLGKRNKERIVPYPQSINSELNDYLQIRDELFGEENSYLLLTSKGEQVYEKLIYRVVKKYLAFVTTARKRSPHIIRHSYATHLLNRGADLNAVKELLGHASLQATQIYTHVSFDQLIKVYKQAHPRGSN